MTRLALLLLLCSCADRAALDEEYRAQRRELYAAQCERVCGHNFQWCLTKRPHSPGACSGQYNDCARDCGPEAR